MSHPTIRPALLLSVLGVAALAACAPASTTSTVSSTSPSASTSSAAPPTALVLNDGWAKSTDGATGEMAAMTGVFGTLKNQSNSAVHVTGGSTPAAKVVELHVTVKGADGQMRMQRSEDGFTIPAGGTFDLKPGANHIMVMGLTEPLRVGESLNIELTTDSGAVPITASVRAFSGANESYHATPMPSGH